jgi:hypothetical protein
MQASQQSMVWASGLSMAAVIIVIIAGFGGVRHALMANGVLVIGMAWAFAWATATVGHLNILSVTFTVTMIGVGIDYGTYYVGRYLESRRRGLSCEAALLETSESVGPGILTGAITTAIAFFCASLTSFVGVAELGTIAGGGILLCCAAELLVLPAVLAIVDRSVLGRRLPEPVPVHTWLGPLMRRPRLVVLAGMACTMAVAGGLHELDYDHNLLNMQPDGLQSVEVEKKLLEECDQSVWYALSIADSREQLLERKERLVALPNVERVDEIASLLPSDEELKRPVIARVRDRLAGATYTAEDESGDANRFARELVRLLKGIPAKINLIPFNPWPGAQYECSDWEQIERFSDYVFNAGYSSPVRTPRGRDILAACGQLKSEVMRRQRAATEATEASGATAATEATPATPTA